jgi:hypothetical protein
LTIRSVCSYLCGWLAKKSQENPSSSALPREPAF